MGILDWKLVTIHPFVSGSPIAGSLAADPGDEGSHAPFAVVLPEVDGPKVHPWLLIPSKPDTSGALEKTYYITNQFYDSGRLAEFYGNSLAADSGRAALWPPGFRKTTPWAISKGMTGSIGGQAIRSWRFQNLWRRKAGDDVGSVVLVATGPKVGVRKMVAGEAYNWVIRSWPDGNHIHWG